MSNTFNFKRFGRFFAYDLRSAWRDGGMSLLMLSCAPLFVFVLLQLSSLILRGRFMVLTHHVFIATFIISMLITVIAFPVRHYGKLTGKAAGSNWILLPVSRFEKYLSLLLITCVVVPAVWFCLMTASDYLLSVIFPHNYIQGYPVMRDIYMNLLDKVAGLNWPGWCYFYLSWCSNILIFTLGALFFRKNKVVFTILVLWGLGIVLSALLGSFGLHGSIEVDALDVERAYYGFMQHIRLIVFCIYLVEFALLDLGIYFRLKSLKH